MKKIILIISVILLVVYLAIALLIDWVFYRITGLHMKDL